MTSKSCTHEYDRWSLGDRLVDIDASPSRKCVLTTEESSTERPRIGVRYENGEEYRSVHPGHYRLEEEDRESGEA